MGDTVTSTFQCSRLSLHDGAVSLTTLFDTSVTATFCGTRGGLYMYASESGRRCSVLVGTGEAVDERFAVNASLIRKIVAHLKEEEVTLSLTDNSLIIASGCAEYTLDRLSPSEDELPEAFCAAPACEVRCDPRDLRRAIAVARHSTDADARGYALDGVKIEIDRPLLRLVTTDGRRLTVATLIAKSIEMEGASDDRWIIPAYVLRDAASLFNRFSERELDIRLSSDGMEIVCGWLRLHAAFLSRRFPDYKTVIPNNFDASFTMDAKGILPLAKQVATTAGETMAAEVSISEKEVSFSSLSPDGSCRAAAKPETVSGSATSRYNPKFFSDFLSALDPRDKVEFRMLKDGVAVLQCIDGRLDCKLVVAPMSDIR